MHGMTINGNGSNAFEREYMGGNLEEREKGKRYNCVIISKIQEINF